MESILQRGLLVLIGLGVSACSADPSPSVEADEAGVEDPTGDGDGDGDGDGERDASTPEGDAAAGDDAGAPPGPTPFEPLPAEDGATFVPVWNDEFEGTEVDTTKWYVQDGYRLLEPENPWRRNWKASNVWVEDGALVIQTIEEADGSFSTGALKTGGYGDTVWLFSQTFGRFEVRAKLPTQPGHWAAFWGWTPGTDGIDGSGRDGSELDIFEAPFRIDRVVHAVHWDGYAASHQLASTNVDGRGVTDGAWHTFALEWYPDEYVFFVDGVESWRTSAGGVCQVPLYFKLTEEIGHYGTGPMAWGVGPIEDAVLPDYYRVDYVRMWQYEAAP
jgi:beta-glucanase (GH16 family)